MNELLGAAPHVLDKARGLHQILTIEVHLVRVPIIRSAEVRCAICMRQFQAWEELRVLEGCTFDVMKGYALPAAADTEHPAAQIDGVGGQNYSLARAAVEGWV